MDRFHALYYALPQAYQQQDFAQVEVLAREYLALAEQHQDDWNYGNAIHQVHTIRGLVALEQGNLLAAKDYLLKSGQVPGSPQLASFGPNMQLAKRLLEHQETEIVLQYLELVRLFWPPSSPASALYLNDWISTITHRDIPDFKANLLYHLS